MWRKNRSPGKRCPGCDLNRNYDFHWDEVGASDNECDDTYAGKKGFSELETSAHRDYAMQIKNRVKLYLTFHAYGAYLLYPWGYTSALPPNNQELNTLANKVAAAIRAVAGTRYEIGTSTNVLYPAAGGGDDWMMGVAGTPLAYTIELPGTSFNPPASKIKPIVSETWEGIKVYGKYIQDKYA